jgi:hypothetical protein
VNDSERPGPIGRAVSVGLLYALVGPPVGGLMYIGIGLMSSLGGSWRQLGELVTGIPLILAFSYFVGGVPALFCGLVASWQTWRRKQVSFKAMAAVGGVASFAFFVLMSAPGDEPLSSLGGVLLSSLGAALSVAAIGAASATICRYLGYRLHRAAA